jgi:hypothetical protein
VFYFVVFNKEIVVVIKIQIDPIIYIYIHSTND